MLVDADVRHVRLGNFGDGLSAVVLALPQSKWIAAADLFRPDTSEPVFVDACDLPDIAELTARIARAESRSGACSQFERLGVESTALAERRHAATVRYGYAAELDDARVKAEQPTTRLGRFAAGIREATTTATQLRATPPQRLVSCELDGETLAPSPNTIEVRATAQGIECRAAALDMPRNVADVARLASNARLRAHSELLFETDQLVRLDQSSVASGRPASWLVHRAAPLQVWR